MSAPTLGARVRAARQALGMTQAELGDRTGLKPSAVSCLETDHRLPSVPTLRKVADGLGVSADHLLGMPNVDADAARKAGLEVWESCSDMLALEQVAWIERLHADDLKTLGAT